MFKKIVIVLFLVIAGILGYAATRPDIFTVSRSTTIKAPPEKVYPLISDFHAWNDWSPWAKMDPTAKNTFSGAEKGKGAIFAWEGNSQVGAGQMEIADVKEPNEVDIKLAFKKPFECDNTVVFKIEPQGTDTTNVSWTMSGKSNFVAKVMQVFCNMDSMVGAEFEKGLADIKKLAEK